MNDTSQLNLMTEELQTAEQQTKDTPIELCKRKWDNYLSNKWWRARITKADNDYEDSAPFTNRFGRMELIDTDIVVRFCIMFPAITYPGYNNPMFYSLQSLWPRDVINDTEKWVGRQIGVKIGTDLRVVDMCKLDGNIARHFMN